MMRMSREQQQKIKTALEAAIKADAALAELLEKIARQRRERYARKTH